MKKIRCIMHADFETPGVILDWCKSNNVSMTIEKPYKGESLSDHDFDFLIVMGGPQSPLEVENFPYLKDEIELIKRAINSHKTILGFCLGAQLIGEALGAKTERSPNKEIGVYPITLTEDGKKDRLLHGFPETFDAIHWHNDMPGLTPESKILAHSEGCPRQIVKYKHNTYGIQCHFEINRVCMEILVSACPKDLTQGKYVRSKNELLRHHYSIINNYMFTILDRLAEKPN
ncbi:MAG: homoserine O-succinyltransferase [Deltaproteobacteria bacterium]|nr:homoserine O-succinyltransferase [Deltaproteobacteria bacterium]